ncbi:MAG TPA: stage II sporulation protein M [Mycobacteriales bacterium]|nr:stage II sporulation protein M [Mycobacteriales bacterium]
MDIDAFVALHRDEWTRLETLVRKAARPGRLTGSDVDELVRLYQRVATHLSLVQTRSPDPVLVARLSHLVATARAAVAGAHAPAWRQVARFFTVVFPVAVYRSRRWWVPTALASVALSFGLGLWVATHPDVQRALLPPSEVRQLVNHDFADYYRAHPAHDFAAQVWTNNVWVAAQVLVGGLLLGTFTLFALLQNTVNVGVIGGYMFAAGRGGQFFGLISPHGILELTAVFVAAGTGLRLGWTIIDPGPRRRADAIAEEGRSTVVIALGLVIVLGVSGVIEAFVTPSGLPTWARVGIGVVAELLFLGYVWTLGRRAEQLGETGDLEAELRGDYVPVAG